MIDFQIVSAILVPLVAGVLGNHNAQIKELRLGRELDRQSIISLTLRVAELTSQVSHLTEEREQLRIRLSAERDADVLEQASLRKELAETKEILAAKCLELSLAKSDLERAVNK